LGRFNVEGIPSTIAAASYGGDDDTDNSGILKYVSIRHGGDKLEANNEINGLTLAGVGSGTQIDYIEVYANLDDGIEWFGGNVSVNHAVVSFCGDDSYDYDQSWDGKGQFWFSLQDELSNRAGEWDGSEATDLGPKVSPLLSNLTFIGAGTTSANEDGNNAIQMRDDGAAKVYNSIFTEFADGAMQLDNDVEPGQLENDAYQRFLDGDITFSNSVFFEFGDGADFAAIVSTDGGDDALLVTHLNDNGNVYADPAIAGISRTNDGGLDPRINGDGAAWAIGKPVGDDYFEETAYAGAFGEVNWAEGWTALSADGYFGSLQSDVDDVDGFFENRTMNIFPNPANGGGKVVKTLSNRQNFVAGNYALSADISDLPNGFYTVNIIADKGIFSDKLLISK